MTNKEPETGAAKIEKSPKQEPQKIEKSPKEEPLKLKRARKRSHSLILFIHFVYLKLPTSRQRRTGNVLRIADVLKCVADQFLTRTRYVTDGAGLTVRTSPRNLCRIRCVRRLMYFSRRIPYLPRLRRSAARRCEMISEFCGIGFCHTQSAPASENSSSRSLPEQPMMIDSILILRMAYTTSVPTITPPASSMY
jgi:hypothetical protein